MPSDKKSGRKSANKETLPEKKKVMNTEGMLASSPNHKPEGGFSKGNKIGNRWKPGKSGNPVGRPRGIKSISESLREHLAKPAKFLPSVMAMGEAVGLDTSEMLVRDVLAALHIINAVEKNSAAYLTELYNRAEGKVPDLSLISVTPDEQAAKIRDALLRMDTQMHEASDEEDDSGEDNDYGDGEE